MVYNTIKTLKEPYKAFLFPLPFFLSLCKDFVHRLRKLNSLSFASFQDSNGMTNKSIIKKRLAHTLTVEKLEM